MIAIVSAAWAAVRSWFSRIPLQLGMAIGAAALAGAFAFSVYKAGRAAAEADALRKLAADNAAVVAQYREDVVRAQDAVARERTRIEALIADNERLKEQVNAVAKGRASPGVDLAVRGMQSNSTKDPAARVSGSRK
jgi:hypothetical protein